MRRPPSFHTAAAVHYRAAVIDATTGEEVGGLPRKKNLILNQGLDLVASERWADCIRYAVAGSGTTALRRDSGAVTVSRAGATLTASAGFFVADDVGRVFKFNTGEEVTIIAYGSSTVCTAATSGTIAASAGTIWAVDQVGLTTEIRRTGTYGTGGTDNTVTLDGGAGTLTQRRTFIFPPEVGTVTYREVGWAPNSSPANDLFGRDLLPGSGLTLGAGQQLKIVLDLVLTLELLTPEAANTLPWSGGTAEQQLENIDWDNLFNPSLAQNTAVFVSESTDAFITPFVFSGSGTALTGTSWSVSATAATYAAGSYALDFSGFFTLNDGNSAAIRCAGFAYVYFSSVYPVLRVRFSAAQTKDSDHSLRLDFRHTWGRVLTN